MRDPAALYPEKPDWIPHLHSAALRCVRDDEREGGGSNPSQRHPHQRNELLQFAH